LGRRIILLYLLLSCLYAANIDYDYLKESTAINSEIGISAIDNPAAINWKKFDLDISQASKVGSCWNNNTIGLGLPFPNIKLGLQMKVDTLSNLPVTYLAGDNTFKTSSTFSHIKSGTILSMGGTLLSPDLHVGINHKLYFQKIQDKSMMGYGVDAGFIYRFLPNIYMGVAFNDIGNTKFKWSDQVSDQIPSHINSHIGFISDNFKLSYINNGLEKRAYVKTQLKLLNFLSTSATIPVDNIYESQASIEIDLNFIKFGYELSFNEIYGQNSKISVSLSLGDLL